MVSPPQVTCFFHKDTNTCTYVVKDTATSHALIIDPVMDFDAGAARTGQVHNEQVEAFCKTNNLTIDYIIETHVHADHLTGANYLAQKFPNAKTAIGENVKAVQALFQQVFNLDGEKDNFMPDGSQFDLLLKDNSEFMLGETSVKVLHTPGHTPACISLVVGDCVFTGDTLFMPDMGTARCDFPGGSVDQLFNSIQRLYELPDETRVFVGHDYAPGGRPIAWESTIGESKANNKQIKAETTLEEFSVFRKARDAQLAAPKLIIPSLQVNLRNGVMPAAESNGTVYLKVPINVVGGNK
uniref:Metallo-beta-lactamase domain-containing protein n=1 Tax=Amphora coffeiformis TaxID=265554 RepID=A0A7S3L973_9STRA